MFVEGGDDPMIRLISELGLIEYQIIFTILSAWNIDLNSCRNANSTYKSQFSFSDDSHVIYLLCTNDNQLVLSQPSLYIKILCLQNGDLTESKPRGK